MALLYCPECGHQVSSQAAACPSCGHPLAPRRAQPLPAAQPPVRPAPPPVPSQFQPPAEPDPLEMLAAAAHPAYRSGQHGSSPPQVYAQFAVSQPIPYTPTAHSQQPVINIINQNMNVGGYAPGHVPYRQKQWEPVVAGLLSFILPGIGQMYRGKVGAGVGWLVGTMIGYMFFLIPGLIIHIVCIVDACSGDPYRRG